MSYATDGKCHNAEPGSFGHECVKPTAWIGTATSGFRSGFCDSCKRHGTEAKACAAWEALPVATAIVMDAQDRVTVNLRLYAYGPTAPLAWEDFRRQICGAPASMRANMTRRARAIALDDETASEVAECIDAPAIAWA